MDLRTVEGDGPYLGEGIRCGEVRAIADRPYMGEIFSIAVTNGCAQAYYR